MKTFKILAAAFLISAATTSVSAQEARSVGQVEQSSEMKAMKKTREMTVRLQLSTEQAEKVRDLNNSYVPQYDDLKATGKTDKEIKAELLPAYEAKLKVILTEQQWSTYLTWKAEKKD